MTSPFRAIPINFDLDPNIPQTHESKNLESHPDLMGLADLEPNMGLKPIKSFHYFFKSCFFTSVF